MIFDFLKKQNKQEKKKQLIQIMLLNLHIPEGQKALYIQAMDILDAEGIDKLYTMLCKFVNEVEIKELADIQKNNFSVIAGMKKKEAEEKKKEINSFAFLLNNL